MNAFEFRPFCSISEPFVGCSNGWLMYYILAMLTVIAFRSPVISLLNLILLALFYSFFGFGIPAMEIIFHWLLGSALGFLIARKYHKRVPPFVEKSILHNLTGFLQMTLILVLECLLYFAVDATIIETGQPYGLVATFLMLAAWLFVACFFLYCVLDIQRLGQAQQMAYWKLWLDISIVVFVAMATGFLAGLNSYIKAVLSACLSAVLLQAACGPKHRE